MIRPKGKTRERLPSSLPTMGKRGLKERTGEEVDWLGRETKKEREQPGHRGSRRQMLYINSRTEV